ncbi:hypothetical protein [Neomegalonema sp.]|uniref:hypothetical protein n=1 Tax=Neomegalonema sp. TaxID=2039713 RepID=UPI002621BADC|nr:hypothetical protein [Neomegalonema sp.]MDD2869620.1 hypothetical protein [Neomegalonema sp.]
MNEIDNLSSDELNQVVCQLEKEYKDAIKSNEVIEQERLELQKKIIQLQLIKKDLDMSLSKSHANLKLKNADLRIARNRYWAVRGEGR